MHQGADIKEDGCIPAHLLGNMWAQSWINIEDLATPFPDSPPVNITPALIEKVYTSYLHIQSVSHL